jgi:hypothetical protein
MDKILVRGIALKNIQSTLYYLKKRVRPTYGLGCIFLKQKTAPATPSAARVKRGEGGDVGVGVGEGSIVVGLGVGRAVYVTGTVVCREVTPVGVAGTVDSV